jgi:hypothetical protein
MGRKFPILFAGTVLDDSDMKDIGTKSGDYLYDGAYGAGNPPPDYYCFGEDDQTFYVSSDDNYSQPYTLNYVSLSTSTGNVKVTQGSKVIQGVGTSWSSINLGTHAEFGVVDDAEAYNPNSWPYTIASIGSDTQLTLANPYRGATNLTGNAEYKIAHALDYGHGNPSKHKDYEEYTSFHAVMPAWGNMHASDPKRDGADWDANYRTTAGKSFCGYTLAAHIMGLKSLWNHDSFFDYVDRYMDLMIGYANRSGNQFSEDMWDAYRANYGPVWPGQPGGQPPIANAGSDQTVIDADSNGNEQVTLNGSASYDSDGTIVSWVWTDDLGDTIPDGEITTAILSVGTHSITLTVTDDDGLSATDTVTITVDGEPKINSLGTLFKNVIDISFDRPLDESLVEDPNNYTINYTVDAAGNSIVVHNVSLDPNLNRARLFTSTHSEDVAYTLKADFIQDEAIYTSNLVGDWMFDEYSGLEAKDSSCKGNTATLVNGPAWTGQGDLSFDGNDDAVEISTADLDADQGTISLWAYAQDFSSKQYLFSHSNQGTTNKIQLYVLAGILCLELGDSGCINWNEILDLQTLYHIALTWDGTTYAVYVNGVKKESSSYSGLTSLNTLAYIGNDGNSRSNAFNGVIDNVKIYNLALTADAISDIFFSEEVKENKSLAFVVSPMDGLTYSVQNQQDLPAGAVFDPNSNTFTWKPWYDQAGGCEITFEGVDGSEQVQDTLTITAVAEDIELSSWYEQWLRHLGLV